RATYARRTDGRIDVINRCTTASGTDQAQGVARVVDERGNGKRKVRLRAALLCFLPMVWGDYWVLGLASDYSWATVGSPDRAYLWILSRTASISADAYAAAVEAARSNGFDVARLTRTEPAGRAK